MVRITDDKKWAPVLGRFMLAFGWIESSVNQLLSQGYPEEQLAKLYERPLGHRFALAKASIAARPLGAEARARVLSNLEAARVLSWKRNHVAHNPLALAMFDVNNDSKRTMREVIVSRDMKDENHIDFETLQALAAQAAEVAAALSSDWIELGHWMRVGEQNPAGRLADLTSPE